MVAYQTIQVKLAQARAAVGNVTNQVLRFANVAADPSPRASVNALLRYRVREALRAGSTVRDLAKKIGISHPIVLDIQSGTHQLSKQDTVEKLAAAFDIPMADLYAHAAKFAKENPALVAEEGGQPLASQTRVEREDRYPERAKAIKAAEALEIRPDAIANVAASHWKAAEARDARWWLAQIQGESDRLDAFDDNPALREQEREQSLKDTAEMLRREQEMLRGRNEKYVDKKK